MNDEIFMRKLNSKKKLVFECGHIKFNFYKIKDGLYECTHRYNDEFLGMFLFDEAIYNPYTNRVQFNFLNHGVYNWNRYSFIEVIE